MPAAPGSPLLFTIDTGDGGQPQRRSTLTADGRTGALTAYETFSDLTAGRRLRTTMRFAHTGEIFGLGGQTIAGLASMGGAVLVWTGLALAWRRWGGWLARRAARDDRVNVRAEHVGRTASSGVLPRSDSRSA
jgi:uncharacterized iron-regulated membrane protein